MNEDIINNLNLNKLTIKDLTLLLEIIDEFESIKEEEIEVI